MKKTKIISNLISTLLILSLPMLSLAHSGRTDANGGHWDRKTGTYHYHNSGKSSIKKSSTYKYTAPKTTKSAAAVKPKEVIAQSISIQDMPDSIFLDDTLTLNAVIFPTTTTDKNITWSSSDEAIASITANTLTACSIGKATITAKQKDVSASFEIEVKPIKADGIEIVLPLYKETQENKCHVKIDEEIDLEAIITPNNTTDKSVKWFVDDEEIATIDENGILKGLSTGTVIVTAQTENGKTAKLEIEIYSYLGVGIAGIGITGIIAFAVWFFIKRKKMN